MIPGHDSLYGHAARLGRANGFDGARLFLALGIVAFHSFTITTGSAAGMPAPVRAAAGLILPAFFALSGYLVAASLERSASVREFAALRLLRILPGLGVVICVTALVLGPILSTLSPHDYFHDPLLAAYFRNILAQPHFLLPGLFEGHPRAGIVNGSLWTIQLELVCYGLLAAMAFMLRGAALTIALAGLGLLLLFPATPFLGLALAWMPAKELPLAFCVGALLFRLRRRVPHHPAIGLWCLVMAWSLAAVNSTWLALPLAYAVIWLALRRIPAWLTRADYSYGLYLVAYPLEQAWLHFFPSRAQWWADLLFTLPLALLCAMALWHFVERPLLARKHKIVTRLSGAGLAGI
jgi:peptidoglycan/LPS O-acetylase OafA/YrhL